MPRERPDYDNALGNLFGQVNPGSVFGIWPSGDFRVNPGDGAVPALVFYLGAALGALALALGGRRSVAAGGDGAPRRARGGSG